MNRYAQAMFAILIVVFAVSLLTASAYALRAIAVAPAGAVNVEGTLVFGENELRNTITCNVTLLRTIERMIPKVRGAIIGKVTGVAIDIPGCRGIGIIEPRIEAVIALRQSTERLEVNSLCAELGGGRKLCVTTGGEPRLWNLVYETFLGALPNITGILFQIERTQLKFQFRALGARSSCLYEGNVFALVAIAAGATGAVRILLELTRLGLHALLEGACPVPGRLSGNFIVRPPQIVTLN